MKTTIKTFAIIAFMLSLSSIYAQSETQVVRSRSNIKTQRTADGDPIPGVGVNLGKGTITETDEGWVFEGVQLTEEQKASLKSIHGGGMPNRISNTPTVGKQTTAQGAGDRGTDPDKLIDSGNFIIRKEGMTAGELKATAKLIASYDLKANKK
jgi:hypothetical protein